MLSIKQLLQYTAMHRRNVVENAKRVRTKIISVTREKDTEGDEYKHIITRCLGNTIPRETELLVWGKGPNAKVWVTCTCEHWMYVNEVAVKRKGSTDIMHSNGARPKITNPNMVASICKHLVACFLHGVHEAEPKVKSKPIGKPKIGKK